VSDAELHFTLPSLALTTTDALLSLRIARSGVGAVRDGALIVQPRLRLLDINPPTGPPEGGNQVTLFGAGFNQHVQVRFAGTVAGDLSVQSSSQLVLRAPAGSFGAVDVAAT
jgi:hypothetical protein